MTLNRNTIPNDKNGAWYTSGLRIGTPAVTTLGMGPAEMKEIAAILALILTNTTGVEKSKANYTIEKKALDEAQTRVRELLARYPVYPELDVRFLAEHFIPQEVAQLS